MNDVAEEVGVRKASLFYHFETKDSLYEAVLGGKVRVPTLVWYGLAFGIGAIVPSTKVPPLLGCRASAVVGVDTSGDAELLNRSQAIPTRLTAMPAPTCVMKARRET